VELHLEESTKTEGLAAAMARTQNIKVNGIFDA
jgi:hypothetical protein